MVESAVYEKIFFYKEKRDSEVEITSDTDLKSKDGKSDVEVIHASSVYVKMNEMNLDKVEEIDTCHTYDSHLKHRLSSSGSSEYEHVSKITYPPPYAQQPICADNEYEITAKMSYTPPSSRKFDLISTEDESTKDNEIPVFQPPSRQSRNLQVPTNKHELIKNTRNKTVYTEIVAATIGPYETSSKNDDGSRKTRKSENPILRQECSPEQTTRHIKRATSLEDIHTTSKSKSHYEFIKARNKAGGRAGRARSCEDRKGVRSMHYENSTPDHEILSSTPTFKCSLKCSRKRRSCELSGFCNNVSGRRYENEVVDLCNARKAQRYENEFLSIPKSNNCHRLYENISEENQLKDEQYYESVSDQESCDYRTRSMSRPIDILDSKQSIERELHYSDIDCSKQSKPFSYSSSSLSTRGSVSSSMSSDFSSFASNSVSPPHILNTRPKLNRFSSWANVSLNSYPANYLGRTAVSRITPECIDSAVNRIAGDTNFIDMKPIFVEWTQENIRFVRSSTWDIIVNLHIQEIIRYEVMLKNAFYVAILAGEPGEEAFCHVLQSDKADDIHGCISKLFQHCTRVPQSRSKSTFDLSPTIEPESHRFHYIVKIGSIKVKRSFSLVSDCMKMVLEKVNPKEFKSCNLDIYGNSVVISCMDTRELETHSTPSILSIGLDEADRRYFGFIISEKAPNNKTKVVCYVYRCARDITAEKIIEAIQSSCKRAISPQFYPNCDLNPIYVSGRSSSVGPLSSPNRDTSQRAWSTCPRSTSMSPSSSYFSLSSTTPCPSDSSMCSCNSRKSSTNIGWKFDNVSLESVEPDSNPTSDKDLERTSFEKKHETVQNIINNGSTNSVRNEERQDKPTKPLGYKLASKFIFGKIKQTILTKAIQNSSSSESRRSSTTPVASPTVSPTPPLSNGLPESIPYDVKYVCSTVITPPLKEKRVKEIWRQYEKEVNKNGKPHSNNSIGKNLNLRVLTNEGVTMVDKNNTIEQQFSMESIDRFMKHPDGIGFFAFSVKIPGNNKHKCHLFSVKQEVLPNIDSAFQKLTAMKQLIS